MLSVLNRRVLILNKYWTAYRIASLRRAVTLLCTNYSNGEPKAKIIDGEFRTYTWDEWKLFPPGPDEDGIKCAATIYRIPDVILLTRYEKLPMQRTNFSKRTLHRRDEGCQYCGKQLSVDNGTIDHILPRAQGGMTSWENCVIACKMCNAKKANRTPEQANMKLLRPPEKPKLNFFKSDSKNPVWEKFIKN